MSLIKNVMLGSDPEIFLVNKETRELVSAIDKIGGSKWAPRELGDGFAIQEDNVLAEINIPPAKTADDFVISIQRGIKLLKDALPGEDLDILIQASGFMPASAVEDERALVFGCDPDFNAWKAGKENDHPKADNPLLRSAGGHIHVGYTLTDKTIQRESVNQNIVRWMDYYLGIPSIVMDKDTERRKLYGKAGAFRHKSYGVEYRTLSSFWLGSDKLIKWAFEQTQSAIKRASNSEFIDDAIGNKVQRIINSTNVAAAEKFVDEYKLVLV